MGNFGERRHLRQLTEGSKRDLLKNLVEIGAGPTSRYFQTVRIAIEIAEDFEAALDRAARAGTGLKWAVLAATAVGAVGAVVGAIAAFGSTSGPG